MGDLKNRITLVPLVARHLALGKLDLRRDYLSASYIQALKSVTKYTTHPVSDADEFRPDLISNRYYGDPSYWWIICFYNGILNPLLELSIGSNIKIPSLPDIQSIVQASSVTQGKVIRV